MSSVIEHLGQAQVPHRVEPKSLQKILIEYWLAECIRRGWIDRYDRRQIAHSEMM